MAHEIKFVTPNDEVSDMVISYKFRITPVNGETQIVYKLFSDWLSDSELNMLSNKLRGEYKALEVFLTKIVRLI